MLNAIKSLQRASESVNGDLDKKRRFKIRRLITDRRSLQGLQTNVLKQNYGSDLAIKLPNIIPSTRCYLRQLRLEQVLDWLILEKDYIEMKETETETMDQLAANKAIAEELQGSPLMVGTLKEIVNGTHAIVSTSLGSDSYVPILSIADPTKLVLECSVLLHHKSNAVVGILESDANPLIAVMKVEKAPLESYKDIGGLESQVQELKEAVELPLLHPELYEDIGITPPKGVILYGPPGTGKTLLAKAVARETAATFLRVVGSELIQKYLGEGPRLVRELFKVAAEHSPSIVFIDEIDAIGTKRYDTNSGGEREIQRTMLELLNQLDGFDGRADIKVIMATNRIEALDPALIRPGRIDRKIEITEPDEKTKKQIFEIHTRKMTLDSDISFNEIVASKDNISGADIKAICTEAGLIALRERRMKVTAKDFLTAKEKALYRKKSYATETLYA